MVATRTIGWSLSTDQIAFLIAGGKRRRITASADHQRLHIVDP